MSKPPILWRHTLSILSSNSGSGKCTTGKNTSPAPTTAPTLKSRINKIKKALTTPRHIDATPLLTATLGIAVVATQATDALSTIIGLSLGGVEMNPIMNRLIQATTPAQFVAAKFAIGLAIAIMFRRRTELLAFLAAVFAAVTVWNLHSAATLLGAG